jgi:sn-glycerol 3-phosphate transport system ATP-binding protein
VELVGAESYVHGSFTDGTTIVFRVPGRSQLGIGENLRITAQTKDFHLFDAAGKRI